MEHEITALAIGGPRHGDWITGNGFRSLMVATPSEPGLFRLTEFEALTQPDDGQVHIYNPQRWVGSNWKVPLAFWVWDGYPRLNDGTPEVPASDMPPYARTGIWPEVCILCEVCRGRAVNVARITGIFRCDDHWPEAYR